MINTVLNVDDICQDCPYFSIETNQIINSNCTHMIYIFCEHHDMCNYIIAHIKKEMNKND